MRKFEILIDIINLTTHGAKSSPRSTHVTRTRRWQHARRGSAPLTTTDPREHPHTYRTGITRRVRLCATSRAIPRAARAKWRGMPPGGICANAHSPSSTAVGHSARLGRDPRRGSVLIAVAHALRQGSTATTKAKRARSVANVWIKLAQAQAAHWGLVHGLTSALVQCWCRARQAGGRIPGGKGDSQPWLSSFMKPELLTIAAVAFRRGACEH